MCMCVCGKNEEYKVIYVVHFLLSSFIIFSLFCHSPCCSLSPCVVGIENNVQHANQSPINAYSKNNTNTVFCYVQYNYEKRKISNSFFHFRWCYFSLCCSALNILCVYVACRSSNFISVLRADVFSLHSFIFIFFFSRHLCMYVCLCVFLLYFGSISSRHRKNEKFEGKNRIK